MGGGGGVLRKRKKKVGEVPKENKRGCFGRLKREALLQRAEVFLELLVCWECFSIFWVFRSFVDKNFCFFGSSKTLFIFLTRKTPLNLPFFGAFVKKNRVMQKGGPKKKRKSSFGKKEGERK